MKNNIRYKMKVFAISDLHLEFYDDYSDILKIIDFPFADILILAGDIGRVDTKENTNILKDFLLYVGSLYKNVIYIAGNHEFYGFKYQEHLKVIEKLRDISKEIGITFLEKEMITIQNINIYGCTLWSLMDPDIADQINDVHQHFKDVDLIHKCFLESFDWLYDQTFDSKSTNIIVTHYPPSDKLQHKKYEPYKYLNSAFYTNIIDDIDCKNITKWYCGHTHERMEYLFIETNPVGYPFEKRETSVNLIPFKI